MTRAILPLVAVVGRPNVGKSTFFNRVVGGAQAVVDDLPGVTRDRREAQASWVEVPFRFMDTGGLVPGTDDEIEAAILTQAQHAVDEAALILFMVDAREGLTEIDREIAVQLRRHSDKVLLVANKTEGRAQEEAAVEATELGFGMPLFLSGQHGQGVGEVLDAIVNRIPRLNEGDVDPDTIHITLVGRPNVGKSSITNRLLGEERVIVHHEAGTTRDAIDVQFRYDNRDYVLVDTAGLRRRTHIEEGVEYYASVRTARSIQRCDIAFLVLDSTEVFSAQDARIASMIHDAGKSIVFVFNKWDLVERETGLTEKLSRALRDKLPTLATAPVVFVSAVTGLRVSRLPAIAREMHDERVTRVSTSRLNAILEDAMRKLQPPISKKGRPVKLFYAAQAGNSPPTFLIFANRPGDLTASYKAFLVNTFRNRLGFRSTPIRLIYKVRS